MGIACNEVEHFRYLEKYLDKHYLSLPFVNLQKEKGIPAILTLFDAHFGIPLFIGLSSPLTLKGEDKVYAYQEGVSQALRWLLPPGSPLRTVQLLEQTTLQEAEKFLGFSSDYFNIERFHKMLERGWATAEVDVSTDSVRFDLKSPLGRDDLYIWFMAQHRGRPGGS